MCNLKIHCRLTIFLQYSYKRSYENYFHFNDLNQLKLILKSSSHNLKDLHLVDIFLLFQILYSWRAESDSLPDIGVSTLLHALSMVGRNDLIPMVNNEITKMYV